MRLTTKVYLATTLVATIGTGAIGSTSVLLSYENEIGRVSKTLTSDTALIDASSYEALSDAITVGQASPYPISIAYLDSSNRLSQIHDDGLTIKKAPDATTLKKSLSKPVTVGDVIVSSLELETGGYLVFESSIAQTNSDLRANVQRPVSYTHLTLPTKRIV